MEEQKVPNVDIYLIWKVDKTEDSSIVNGVWYIWNFISLAGATRMTVFSLAL
jgi:hypothetical protein